MTIVCYQVFPSGRLSFPVSTHNPVWLFADFFSFSWSQYRPQSNFKKSEISFSPSCHSEKMLWGQSLAESSLSTFSWLYILVFAVVQKYHKMFSETKFFLVLILESTCFICITWKRKQTMEQQPHRACEWTKSNQNKTKQKQNKLKSRHIQNDHAFYFPI